MKLKLLSAVIALQVASLLAIIVPKELDLRHGRTALLETVPVDPRDLLRGDYVILRYKISALSSDLLPEPLRSSWKTGDSIWVRLEQQGEFHQAAEASLSRPRGRSGGLWLRGTIAANTSRTGPGFVEVHYGLERYYVREGTGNPRGTLTVRIAVPESGVPAIQDVYIDGRPYAEVMSTTAR